MHPLPAGLALAAPLTLGAALGVAPASGDAAPAPAAHTVLRFHDPAIVEASALVVDDGLFLTTNDSGDTGRVFAVDAHGRTVGETRWDDEAVDTEAMAPGGHGYVWVGDIGDNTGRRPYVDIARVPVGARDRTVSPTTYRLTYPDGATDAESLLSDPTTGRLYVASKNVFGGVLYAVPAHLDPTGPNRLHQVGRVLPLATDGAFFPDGRHLVVRSYSTAVVYAWPSMQPVGQFAMPRQRQGEGIAVAADGRVYVDSEGLHQPVLALTLPPEIAAAVRPAVSAGPGPSAASDPAQPRAPLRDEPPPRDPWPWVAGGLLGLAAVVVLLRALRPR